MKRAAGVLIVGLALLAPACLGARRGLPPPGVAPPPATASAPRAVPTIRGVASASSSLPGWQPGNYPQSSDIENCGAKEGILDVYTSGWHENFLIDPKTCLATKGCPPPKQVPFPDCLPSEIPIIDVATFLENEVHWRDEEVVRLRGPLFVSDPTRRLRGITRPTSGGDEDECYPRQKWDLSLQATRGDLCLEVVLEPTREGPYPFPRCPGDLSRSCCGGWPMGQVIVVTAQLRVFGGAGEHLVHAGVLERCRERPTPASP